MTIKEKGYTHWDGEFKKGGLSWLPITSWGIRLTFKKKFFKLLFFISLIPAIVFLAGIYISERLEDFRFMIRESADFVQINPAYFKSYFTNDFLLFMIVMILVFCGAGLISDDLKHNALQLYFSRPLKKKDYFWGKVSVITFFLFLITLVPGIILFLMKLVFSGSFRFFASYPWLPLSIVIYSLFVTAFYAFYTLFLSSISKNRRYVAIFIFGLYIFSDILFGIFYGIFRSQYFSLLSIKSNIQQVGAFIFNQRTPFNIPWALSLAVLFFFCLIAAVVLNKRVRGVEIIK